MDSCSWRHRSKWHCPYSDSMTHKWSRFACIDGKVDSQLCPDQTLCACSTTTLSHLIFYVFYYPQHRRHPNSNKALLAQAKHWMPEGLKLLSHCSGGSRESQKQSEAPWPQLLCSLCLLCLQTELLFIFTGLWTNSSVRWPSVFPHFNPFDGYYDLVSQYVLVTHICWMFSWVFVTSLSFSCPFSGLAPSQAAKANLFCKSIWAQDF